VVKQPRVQVGQGRAALERQVGAVFRLVQDPVTAPAKQPGLPGKGFASRAQRSRSLTQGSRKERSASRWA
jgi:hypothetical protein